MTNRRQHDRVALQRCPLTADTIVSGANERWRCCSSQVSKRDRYIEGLEPTRRLDFNLLAPSAAPTGQPHYTIVDGAAAAPRPANVRRGENN
jgi:hypothetical protein